MSIVGKTRNLLQGEWYTTCNNMISSEELKKVCAQYDIGDLVSLEEIGEGALNRNYLLHTTAGKYFIKSVREKMKDKLVSVYAVESYMKSKGIPAVVMIATTSGDIFYTSLSEVYTIYPFIESDRNHSYNSADYTRMGEMLGKIHRVGSVHLPELLHSVKHFALSKNQVIVGKFNEYKEDILRKTDPDEIDKLFLRYLDFKLEIIPKIEIVTLENDTFTHGDYHSGNLLIDEESREIIGVCDWEKAEYAPRSYELARSLLYACLIGQTDLQVMLENSKAFYKGYLAVYPMSKDEIIRGLWMRIHKTALSSWIEEAYYHRQDDRANKFIETEMDLVDIVVNKGLLSDIEKLVDDIETKKT